MEGEVARVARDTGEVARGTRGARDVRKEEFEKVITPFSFPPPCPPPFLPSLTFEHSLHPFFSSTFSPPSSPPPKYLLSLIISSSSFKKVEEMFISPTSRTSPTSSTNDPQLPSQLK